MPCYLAKVGAYKPGIPYRRTPGPYTKIVEMRLKAEDEEDAWTRAINRYAERHPEIVYPQMTADIISLRRVKCPR